MFLKGIAVRVEYPYSAPRGGVFNPSARIKKESSLQTSAAGKGKKTGRPLYSFIILKIVLSPVVHVLRRNYVLLKIRKNLGANALKTVVKVHPYKVGDHLPVPGLYCLHNASVVFQSLGIVLCGGKIQHPEPLVLNLLVFYDVPDGKAVASRKPNLVKLVVQLVEFVVVNVFFTGKNLFQAQVVLKLFYFKTVGAGIYVVAYNAAFHKNPHVDNLVNLVNVK